MIIWIQFTNSWIQVFLITMIKDVLQEHIFSTLKTLNHLWNQIDLIGSTNIGIALNEGHGGYRKEKGENEYSKLLNFLIKTSKEQTALGMLSYLLCIDRRK